jgi:hypothetical protein
MTAEAQGPAPLLDKYIITVVVPLEYEVQANTIKLAAAEAGIILQAVRQKHPAAKILRIMSDVTYVALEGSSYPAPPKPPRPRGGPAPGGTPGTPIVRTPENLDVVAKVA